MANVSQQITQRRRRGVSMLLLFWIIVEFPPSLLQPLLPLSLPVHMELVPHAWSFLPLSHAELGPLFSNSSPFSFSQSLFVVPAYSRALRPSLRASFGPFSVTQLISESVLPLSPPLSVSLLSHHVAREEDEGGQERFIVRVVFHKWGHTNSKRTCITLHAFKETEEHRAFCVTQPPLGLCMVTLRLPSAWFENQHTNQSYQDSDRWRSSIHAHRRHRRRHHSFSVKRQHETSLGYRSRLAKRDFPQALRYQWGPMQNPIQLYYSSFNIAADFESTPQRCIERVAHSQRQLFHIQAVTLKKTEMKKEISRSKEEETCLNGQDVGELSLDSHVLIHYHKGLVQIGKKPVMVSVNLRANFSAEFVIIRLKVKKGLVSIVAQRTLMSHLWAVTLEKSQGSDHDMVSIFCHKHNTLEHPHNPTLLQQVVCLSVDALGQSFGVAMAVHAAWWVEYSGKPVSPRRTAVSTFSFTDRHISGIAPITESNTIVNTAILTNQPVSLPVIVLAISLDGKVSDVTSAVTCHSTNENTVKVSSDCSTLFVDGSESALGCTCAVVEFLLGTLRGSVCLEVWAPSVPLRVSLSDPVLNAIDGWNHFTEKGCVPVYQRSSIQVLTQFTAQDSHSKMTYLLGSSDWFVDVTELVLKLLRIEDPEVASFGAQNSLIGLQPGKTSLHVISEQWDGVLGRCDITVTAEAVTLGDLSVQVISDLGMSVSASPAHPSIITTIVTAYNILYNHHQEASINVWLQFSDDTASLLSSFSDLPSILRLSSLAETVVVVPHGPSHRVFAQGEGGGPLLSAELLVSVCTVQPLTSNSISEGDRDWIDSGGGSTRRLARGSGWIRVNFDQGFLHKSEEGREFGFDISDTLVEPDSDIYMSNFNNEENSNGSSDYYGKSNGKLASHNWNTMENGGMVHWNILERAVLMSSQEEGAVHFSPSKEKQGGKMGEENQKEGLGAPDLEVGVGAVLSLLGLFTVLFLANCLPCMLRDRRKITKQERRTELEEGTEEEERKNTENEEKKQHQQHGDSDKDVKQLEIIC